MNKQDFLLRLRERLAALPQEDVEERLNFYEELIQDGMEEGLTEEEAVAQIGSADAVADGIIAEIPLVKIAQSTVKETVRRAKRPGPWLVVLLVLGSPLWISLLVAAGAVILSAYAVLWSLVVSVWATFGALAGVALGGLLGGGVMGALGHLYTGLACLAGGLVCGGLAIFLFFGCKAATVGAARLTRGMAVGIKLAMFGRRGA